MLTDTIEDARKEMDKTVEAFRHELARVRTGRASTALVENLQVNYYGSKTPLRQLAGLSAPEPRLIVITPYDKGAMHDIEKAIQTSDLGLQPMNDGKIIRIPIPELTEERQRPGEARAQNRRRVPRRHPQPSARRQRHAQGTAQGQAGDGGRDEGGGDQGADVHDRVHRKNRQSADRQRSGNHGGLSALSV